MYLTKSCKSFEVSGREMRFAIPGDKACPINTYIMMPFARKDLSCEERVFNWMLSRAGRCIECAFWCADSKLSTVT